MKTLKLLLITCCLIFTATACEENQDLITEDNLSEVSLKTTKQVEIPFKAKLFTSQADDALSVIC